MNETVVYAFMIMMVIMYMVSVVTLVSILDSLNELVNYKRLMEALRRKQGSAN